jgi:hypothetical protein
MKYSVPVILGSYILLIYITIFVIFKQSSTPIRLFGGVFLTAGMIFTIFALHFNTETIQELGISETKLCLKYRFRTEYINLKDIVKIEKKRIGFENFYEIHMKEKENKVIGSINEEIMNMVMSEFEKYKLKEKSQ